MAESEANLILEFTKWLNPLPGTFANYYVGIAADPLDRLVNGHGLEGKDGKDTWRYDFATNDTVARKVEAYFKAKGMKGGPGGGNEKTRGVYIYKTTPRSRE